ncbi:hypothetical protein AQI88_11580 [Streptomyces cellostaticus]|uniref:Uncharacterized protein n=1 Tax=Streptomyces cellostaticus TaxID=67285 RepID=A0A124HD46_9ACTN|nr:hypothetical protein [Streptomyces cellostaticus]KUM96423.1 hypothetical protein AQI88_11580 [Streptomyces cellostaticus]GHI08880.1 hypothetical protein Scel_72010 [Streptomyces cellostaticus]
MPTPALAAALADIGTVFNGFASPAETGCERCFAPEETAFLRTPYTRLPTGLLRRFVYKVPDHFEDHAAVMRRLLPQCAQAMADGSLGGIGYHGYHGLSRVDWRSWPTEQASAVESFVLAWWDDVLITPDPPCPVQDVFETCASILRTMTPLLDRWEPHPVADTHLVGCAGSWLYDLITDRWPFTWWIRDDEAQGVAELRSWLARHASGRLHAQGEPDLATRARLVGLTYEERWNDPYWASPSDTN